MPPGFKQQYARLAVRRVDARLTAGWRGASRTRSWVLLASRTSGAYRRLPDMTDALIARGLMVAAGLLPHDAARVALVPTPLAERLEGSGPTNNMHVLAVSPADPSDSAVHAEAVGPLVAAGMLLPDALDAARLLALAPVGR